MVTKLNRIRQYSQNGERVENLASLITVESLKAIHFAIDGKKAAGIDGVKKEAYETHLSDNIEHLVERMKRRSYKPKPSRRTYIDKVGSQKKRPLGISSYEDKLVETRIAQILTEVYEPKFLETSYGYRPGRGCHDAIKDLIGKMSGKTSYVVEADIRSFFDKLDHDWLMKFLKHDIADSRFLEIVQKFLKAGVVEKGKLLNSESGSPQGNAASAILANVYLHYVFDLWFEKSVKPSLKGEAHIVRYADDFVVCFQYWDDAIRFYNALPGRFAKFGLELAEEKTQIMQFGRFAAQTRKHSGKGKPRTITFLGFTFYCSRNRADTQFVVKLVSSRKKMTDKLMKMNQWIKANRHLPVKELIARINRSLVGHYCYYGVTHNGESLKTFLHQTAKYLYKWLNKRSQKRSYNWETFRYGLLRTIPLAIPKIRVNLYD